MEYLPLVRARIRGTPGGRASCHQVGLLTPYLAQLIIDEVLRRGPGVRLEVAVARGTGPRGLRTIQERLAPLATRGVPVVYRWVRPRLDALEPDAA